MPRDLGAEGRRQAQVLRACGRAHMTADGSEDKKIKLESTPQGYKLTIPEPVPA